MMICPNDDLPTVQLATNLAVGHFNDHATNIITILTALGIKPGHNCVTTCRQNDKNRIYFTKRQLRKGKKAGEVRSEIRGKATLKPWRTRRDHSTNLVPSKWKTAQQN